MVELYPVYLPDGRKQQIPLFNFHPLPFSPFLNTVIFSFFLTLLVFMNRICQYRRIIDVFSRYYEYIEECFKVWIEYECMWNGK